MTHDSTVKPTRASDRAWAQLLFAALPRSLRSGFARHVAVVVGGTAIGQAISLLASPILTRLYTPAEFGILGVFVSILGLSTVSAALRYEVAIPLPESDAEGKDLLLLSLLCVLGTALVAGIVVLTSRGQLARHFGQPELRRLLWLLPLGIAGAGSYQVLSFWALRVRAFGSLSRTKISQSIIQVSVQVLLGTTHLGALGLVTGDVVGRAGGSGTLAALALRGNGETPRRSKWKSIRAVAVRYRRFPLLSTWSALLNAATLQVPLLLLATFYGATTAGMYALGQRVLAAPLGVLGNAVSNVFYSLIARTALTEPERLKHLFVKMSVRLLLVALVPVSLVLLAGPWATAAVFGDEWREAGVLLQLVTPMLLTQFVASPLGGTLDVLERQDLHFLRELVRQALMIGSLLVAKILDLAPHESVFALSMGATAGNLIYIASTWYALRDVATKTTHV